MNSVELLEEAVDAARRVGFRVREEWFGGSGGGACAVRGQKLLFLDLNLGPRERLQQALDGPIPCDPWHAVKVGIVTRDVAHSARLHDGDDQCVVAEQAIPYAQIRS